MKKLGRYQLAQIITAVEPFMMALYTRFMGFTVDETKALIDGIRAELRNPRNHLYCQFHFIYGQKPVST